ncbi:MAG: DUF4198 domain-containing protein [Gemmataceae bacterium]|nr:DUF4198 domain-containing protein [Gemmataceae bacterium]
MIHRQSVLAVLLTFLFTSPAFAHDLWLIPPIKATAKQSVVLEASVGMEFPVSVGPPKTEGYPRKFVIGPDGKMLLLKSAGTKDLVSLLEFTPTTPGIQVIAVETTPRIIELDADKFNEYLVTDGLPHIFRLRAKEKTLNQPAKERYRKSPTALLRVGDGTEGEWNKAIGLPLQIVPLQNPFERKVGDTLRVKIFFQKELLAGANVGWQRPGDGDTPIGYVRTDAKGEALIPIAQTGLLTIRLTHMTRPKMPDYEWESFWTTLTVRVP